MQHSFTGRIFGEPIDAGQAEVDIEFTRSGISAMTTTGQFFEIPFSQCILRIGGVGRRLLFCHNSDQTLTICCEDRGFPQALCEASLGLLEMQLERQLRYSLRESNDRTLLGVNLIVGMAMLLVGAYLVAQI